MYEMRWIVEIQRSEKMQIALRTIACSAFLVTSCDNAASENYEKYSYFPIGYLNQDRTSPQSKSAAIKEVVSDHTAFYLDGNGRMIAESPKEQSNKSGYDFYKNDRPAINSAPFSTKEKKNNNRYELFFPCPDSPAPSGQILALVEKAARAHSIDPHFAMAVAWVESRMAQVRKGPKRAPGAIQLKPDTAHDPGVADICDPASSIDDGVRYLRALLDEFTNPLLAAAAYKAGPQAVRDHKGVPPYPETVTYLANILNFQLGLPVLASRLATGNAGRDEIANGVIADMPTARFVGGVMKF